MIIFNVHANSYCDISGVESGGKKLICHNLKNNFIEAVTNSSFLDDVREVIVNKPAMTNITEDFFDKLDKQLIQTVAISNAHIPTLNKHSFNGLTQLFVLNLTGNNIANVSDKTFHLNNKLTLLNLMDNKIEELKQNTFSTLINLEYINLSMNRLKHLPKHIFEHNINLVTLVMRRNKLTEIPDVRFMQKLSSLDLSSNRIEVLSPHVFKNNYNLKYVDLHRNRIKNLVSSLSHLGLKELNLLENPLNMSNHTNQEVVKVLNGGDLVLRIPEHKHKSNVTTGNSVYKIPSSLQFVLIGIMVLLVLIVTLLSVLLYHVYIKKNEVRIRQHGNKVYDIS